LTESLLNHKIKVIDNDNHFNRKLVSIMDLLEAIRTRRSIQKMKSAPVPQALIEQILEAATWAPNHFLTEPWRFIVLQGEGRKQLGKVFATLYLEKQREGEGIDPDLLEKQVARAFRAPVVIVVIATPSPKNHVIPREEFAACCAGVQNMLLTAHALGLGAIWRTGPAATHPRTRELFLLEEREEVVGFIYIGYPDQSLPKRKRTPFQNKTLWLNDKVM
jgi:nitroreductase